MPTEADDTITLTTGHVGNADERQIEVPRRLGSVRLTQEIGRGGMGVVWLGRDELLGRDVAVKFLLNIVTGTDDPGFLRFIDGARAATAARHASLTTIYHADTIQNTPYLVMEYVNGASLSDIISTSGPLSDSTCLAVLEDVCDALGELHDRHIIHRDIKPGNVLIDLEGRVFLTDFGLACARPAEGSVEAASVSGTPAYMAPEMFDGTISERSDVYALGLMTYQMLTGQRAFSGPLAQVRRQHMLKAMPTKPLEERGASEELIELLERATNKDALFRYKTARHFFERLVEAFPVKRSTPTDRRALAALVAQARGSNEHLAPAAATGSSDSSYYDTIAKRAARKRSDSDIGLAAPDPSGSSLNLEDETIPVGEAIPFDLNCPVCDYNLRGLNPNGQCPECGEAIAAGLRRNRLVFAPRAWLSTMIVGIILLLVSMGLNILIPVCQTTIFLILSRSLPTQAYGEWARTIGITFSITGYVNVVLLIVATVFLTRTCGEQHTTPLQALLKWLTRAAVVGYLVMPVIRILVISNSTLQTALLINLIDKTPFYLYYAVVLGYLTTVANRIPNTTLERRLSLLAWILASTGAVLLIGALSLASLLVDNFTYRAVTGVAYLILLILSFGQLLRIHYALNQVRSRQSNLTAEHAEAAALAAAEAQAQAAAQDSDSL